jgi:signal peptidase I
LNYIKRIVGIPGDVVQYKDKQLTINNKLIVDKDMGPSEYLEINPMTGELGTVNVNTKQETIDNHTFNTFIDPQRPTLFIQGVKPEVDMANCQYDGNDGFTCKIPEGKYFAMGDNRDNSEDSRYWGFVDDKYIVGKAAFIWMNFKDKSRIGTTIQ